MPFIAYTDDQYVIPEDVDDGEDVFCPECNGVMRVRGPFDDGRSRHFYHVNYRTRECPGSSGGGGGPAESEVHQKLKAKAVSGLREEFDAEYEYCRPEVSIQVAETETDANTRRADVLLKFTETNQFYGKGIIVEVQHLNAGKDIRATTHDYLKSDFSAYWATIDDFDEEGFVVEQMNTAFSNRAEPAFSTYHDVPPALEAPDRLISPDDQSKYTTRDLVPECDHQIVKKNKSRYCVRCGMEMEMCYYDEYREKLRPTELVWEIPSNSPIIYAAVKDSVDYPVEIQPVERTGSPPDHGHNWGRGVDITYGYKYRCGKCDSIMITSGDDIYINGPDVSNY